MYIFCKTLQKDIEENTDKISKKPPTYSSSYDQGQVDNGGGSNKDEEKDYEEQSGDEEADDYEDEENNYEDEKEYVDEEIFESCGCLPSCFSIDYNEQISQSPIDIIKHLKNNRDFEDGDDE